MPALPLDTAGKYVAGAYLVFLTLVLVYVAIIGAKIARIEREVTGLVELVDEDGDLARSAVGTDNERPIQDAELDAPRR